MVLRPLGIKITLPKPPLIIDSMEQKGYTFKSFQKWFAAIEKGKLPVGNYSIASQEDRMAEEKPAPPFCRRCYMMFIPTGLLNFFVPCIL